MTRQRLLSDDNPLQVEAVIGEAAVRTAVGGPVAMSEQLDRLAEFAARPNITIPVIPFDVGAYPAIAGTLNAVRDSKNPNGGVLWLDLAELMTDIKSGRFA